MQFLAQYWIILAIDSLVLYSDGINLKSHARDAPNMSALPNIWCAQATGSVYHPYIFPPHLGITRLAIRLRQEADRTFPGAHAR